MSARPNGTRPLGVSDDSSLPTVM